LCLNEFVVCVESPCVLRDVVDCVESYCAIRDVVDCVESSCVLRDVVDCVTLPTNHKFLKTQELAIQTANSLRHKNSPHKPQIL
jgi:hypothetical protein